MIAIDGIQYSGATVAFLGPTHRFLCFYGVLPGGSIHAKTTNRGRGHVADLIQIWTVY